MIEGQIAWFIVKILLCIGVIFTIVPLVLVGIVSLVGGISDLIKNKK